jgi:hypothetical protein
MSSAPALIAIAEASVPLDRDVFLRTLIRELAGTLEEVVGVKNASGCISVVGRKIGEQMNRDYKAALGTSNLTREQVAAVLVDLKRRIQATFMSSRRATKGSCSATGFVPLPRK